VVAAESAVFQHPTIEQCQFSTVQTLATQETPARSKTRGWYVVDGVFNKENNGLSFK
jgi:hypothetical protein